jgi:hypothetical protein
MKKALTAALTALSQTGTITEVKTTTTATMPTSFSPGSMHFNTGNLFFTSWQEREWTPSYLRLQMYPQNLPVSCPNRPKQLNDPVSAAFLAVSNGSYVQPPGVPYFGPNRVLNPGVSATSNLLAGDSSLDASATMLQTANVCATAGFLQNFTIYVNGAAVDNLMNPVQPNLRVAIWLLKSADARGASSAPTTPNPWILTDLQTTFTVNNSTQQRQNQQMRITSRVAVDAGDLVALLVENVYAPQASSAAGFQPSTITFKTLSAAVNYVAPDVALAPAVMQLQPVISPVTQILLIETGDVAGPTGPTGDRGETGGVGPTGDRGAPSTITGPTGAPSVIPGPTGPASTIAGPTGAKGADSLIPGPTGAASTLPGPTGAKGAASLIPGPTGANGEQGGTGATGAAGAVGPTGLRGQVGMTGERGLTGGVGPTGGRGELGNTGDRGPTGIKGADSLIPGPTGAASTITGPTGAKGADSFTTGPTGAASTIPGPTGAKGADSLIPGPTGAASTVSGPTGAKGADSLIPGPTGVGGQTGERGATGDRGPTGARGEVGSTADRGATGATGDRGAASNVTGPTGAAGSPGLSSFEVGPTGNVGPTGDQGPTGERGSTGMRGETGADIRGESYFFAVDRTSQRILNPDVWQDVGFNSHPKLRGWTHGVDTGGNSRFTCLLSGLYSMCYKAWMMTTKPTQTAEFELVVEGTPIVGSQAFISNEIASVPRFTGGQALERVEMGQTLWLRVRATGCPGLQTSVFLQPGTISPSVNLVVTRVSV